MLPVCLSCATCIRCPPEVRGGCQIPSAGVTDSWDPPCGAGSQTLVLCRAACALAAGLSLRPLGLVYSIKVDEKCKMKLTMVSSLQGLGIFFSRDLSPLPSPRMFHRRLLALTPALACSGLFKSVESLALGTCVPVAVTWGVSVRFLPEPRMGILEDSWPPGLTQPCAGPSSVTPDSHLALGPVQLGPSPLSRPGRDSPAGILSQNKCLRKDQIQQPPWSLM